MCLLIGFSGKNVLASALRLETKTEKTPVNSISLLQDYCSNSSKNAIISKLLCPFFPKFLHLLNIRFILLPGKTPIVITI